jgi:hypothetical protein
MTKWLDHYRSNKDATWIKCQTLDGEWHYFHDHKVWLELKKAGVGVKALQLQFRSHIVDIPIEDCDGVYLVKALVGITDVFTRDCLTVGLVREDKVSKSRYSLPELVLEDSSIDPISKCFAEAIIYEKESENREK